MPALHRGGRRDNRRKGFANRGRGDDRHGEAVDLTRHAESIGADGIRSVSPYYWKVGEEALFKHFVTVAESVEVPTLVYNFPMLPGIDLSPTLLARLARECPSIVGVKDTVKEFSSYYAEADVPYAA